MRRHHTPGGGRDRVVGVVFSVWQRLPSNAPRWIDRSSREGGRLVSASLISMLCYSSGGGAAAAIAAALLSLKQSHCQHRVSQHPLPSGRYFPLFLTKHWRRLWSHFLLPLLFVVVHCCFTLPGDDRFRAVCMHSRENANACLPTPGQEWDTAAGPEEGPGRGAYDERRQLAQVRKEHNSTRFYSPARGCWCPCRWSCLFVCGGGGGGDLGALHF